MRGYVWRCSPGEAAVKIVCKECLGNYWRESCRDTCMGFQSLLAHSRVNAFRRLRICLMCVSSGPPPVSTDKRGAGLNMNAQIWKLYLIRRSSAQRHVGITISSSSETIKNTKTMKSNFGGESRRLGDLLALQGDVDSTLF